MKCKVIRSELSDAVKIMSTLNVKQANSMVSNILLDCTENALKLSKTNLDCFHTRTIHASDTHPGKALVNNADLNKALAGFSSDVITLGLVDNKLILSNENARSELDTPISHFPEDFVPFPEDRGPKVSFTYDRFMEIHSLITFCADRKAFDIKLSAVCFKFTENMLAISATNAKHLSVIEMEQYIPSDLIFKEFLVPATSLDYIKKNAKKTEPVEFEFGINKLRVSFQNEELFFRYIDGRFPDYKRVIPKEHSRSANIEVKKLKPILKSVAPIAKEHSDMIELSFSEGRLKVSCINRFSNVMPCEFEGDDINICFNCNYLIEFLNSISEEMIKITMTTPTYPIKIEFNVGDPLDFYTSSHWGKFTYVLMPMSY